MQFQLIFWSVLSLLVLAVVAGGYAFWSSYKEINEFQDDNLKSMSALLEQTINVSEIGSNARLQSNIHFYTDDADGSITVDVINTAIKADDRLDEMSKNEGYGDDFSLESPHLEDPDLEYLTLEDLAWIPVGISTKTLDGKAWRIYRSNSVDKVIIVRQRTEFRDDLAKSSAYASFLPLIIGIAFLTLLLPFIMWRMLKPVRQLHNEINQRRENDLNPLSIHTLPTELMPLAESLNRLLMLVKTSIERQQRFIADAAHEMRSPLTAISLQLQRLQRITNDEVLTQGLDKLAVRLKRNQRLVEQLLNLARAGNINISTNTEHNLVSVKAIVGQVIGLLIPIADHKNIELTVQLLANDHVSLDETSCLLLVKNLIQNAIVYTPQNGHVMVKIFQLKQAQLKQDTNDFETSHSNSQSDFGTHIIKSGKIDHLPKAANCRLVLQIIDSGEGIHPHEYANVFEPFVRLSQPVKISESLTDVSRSDGAVKSNHIDGTGLGLSIVKSICEQAGIDVFMNSSTLATTEGKKTRGLCVTLLF